MTREDSFKLPESITTKLYDLTGDAYGETKVDKEKKNAKPSDKLLNATYNHPFEVPKNVQ